MTQATPDQFESLGSVKENVRHNDKAIDELRSDFKVFQIEVRKDFSDMRAEIKGLSDKLNSFQLQFYGGVLVLPVANILIEMFIPG